MKIVLVCCQCNMGMHFVMENPTDCILYKCENCGNKVFMKIIKSGYAMKISKSRKR